MSRPVPAVVCRARQRVAALNMGRMAALLSSGAGVHASAHDSVDAGLHALDATATRTQETQWLVRVTESWSPAEADPRPMPGAGADAGSDGARTAFSLQTDECHITDGIRGGAFFEHTSETVNSLATIQR